METLCNTCKFWDRFGDRPTIGLCRFHAPLAVSVSPKPETTITPLSDFSHLDAQWPSCKSDDWCGEWDRRVETPADEG